jgi:hypothetical protein
MASPARADDGVGDDADTFTVTFFSDYAAERKREASFTIGGLAELIRTTCGPTKGSLPWLKLARFGDAKSDRGSLRHDRNLIAVSGIEADYDGEQVSFETAVEMAEKAGLRCILYTSPSHRPGAPRWRILCPASRELSPAQRARMVTRINGLYGGIFAVESWTLSQSYYYGSVDSNPGHRVAVVDGIAIDCLDELDKIAIGKPATGAANGNANGAAGGPVDELMLLEQIKSGASFHTAATRLLGLWATRGVPLMEARQQLVTAFEAVFPPDRDARWHARFADIDRCLLDIYGKQAAHLDAAASNNNTNGAADDPIIVHDAGDIDVARIPPRGWLLGVTFCRNFISGLIAEGGAGKTAIRYVQYLAAAAGRSDLTGEHVHHRCRVLIVCLEDNLAEVQRRIGAAILHHRVSPEDVKGWLLYCTPKGLKLLQTDTRGVRSIGQLYTELKAIIGARRIDIVGIDPFVKSHGVEENDNNAIDQVCIMLANIADDFDCAVDIVSHARKGQAIPGDVERERGASSKKDAGRLLRTATNMTADEAKTFGVEERDRPTLIRVDDAKVNITPKSSDTMWFRLVSVPIGNTLDPRYPKGDSAQTVERWHPPDAWKGLSAEILNVILDEIDQGLPAGRLYSQHGAAVERAAWRVVTKHIERNEAQAREIIKTWLKNGVLKIVDYYDEAERKDRKGLRVEPSKRPG